MRAPSNSVYHAFVHKLDAFVRLLADNVRMNKRASSGNVDWGDVVALCRDALAGVSAATTNTNPN